MQGDLFIVKVSTLHLHIDDGRDPMQSPIVHLQANDIVILLPPSPRLSFRLFTRKGICGFNIYRTLEDALEDYFYRAS